MDYRYFSRGLLMVAMATLVTACGSDDSDDSDSNAVALQDWSFSVDKGSLEIDRLGSDNRSILSTAGIAQPIVAQRVTPQTSENRALFKIEKTVNQTCENAVFQSVRQDKNTVIVAGVFDSPECDINFEMRMTVVDDKQLDFELTTSNPDFNAITLVYRSAPDEHFFGFGEQYSFLDLKGQTVPVLAQEQGIGRSGEPLTSIVEALFPGASGTPLTTYYPVPEYVSSKRRGLSLDNTEFSVFDLSDDEEVRVSLLSNTMTGHLFAGDRMLDVISAFTRISGRMQPLPDWINSGAVVGLQGGATAVRTKLAPLEASGAPIAAVWIQDWVGQRDTVGGAAKQLWWNWELDKQRYPDWDQLVAELNNEGTEVMGYINPFLVDVSSRQIDVQRNLYKEALNLGYLVTDDTGKPVQTTITDFTAGIVDLTNPDARQWLSEVIRTNMLGIGFKGWMADFGEALPLDNTLKNGKSGLEEHNRYPERWAQLNADSVEEAGAGDIVYFMRSGFTRSPGKTPLFWLGDQATLWDKYDGLQSAIVGMINGGFSGLTLNHSDIGGYTSLVVPLSTEQAATLPEALKVNCSDFGLQGNTCARLGRTPELLTRWMEVAAFTAIFRTHEGLSPNANAQIYSEDPSNPGTYPLARPFSVTANVYAALADYRKGLFKEAAEKGYPVVRHPLLHYPDDSWFSTMQPEQVEFMLGPDFMVAPIIKPSESPDGSATREVHLPEGTWVYLWNQYVRNVPAGGETFSITTPLGQPPVWFRADSEKARKAARAIQARLAPLLSTSG